MTFLILIGTAMGAAIPGHASSEPVSQPGATVVRCADGQWLPLELRHPQTFERLELASAFPETQEAVLARIDEYIIELAERVKDDLRNGTLVPGSFVVDSPSLPLPAGCESRRVARVLMNENGKSLRIFENQELLAQIDSRYHAWLRIRTLAGRAGAENETTTVLRAALSGSILLPSDSRENETRYMREFELGKALEKLGLPGVGWRGLPVYGVSESPLYSRVGGMTFRAKWEFSEPKSRLGEFFSYCYSPWFDSGPEEVFDRCHLYFSGDIREAGITGARGSLPGVTILRVPRWARLENNRDVGGSFSTNEPFLTRLDSPVGGHAEWNLGSVSWNKDRSELGITMLLDRAVRLGSSALAVEIFPSGKAPWVKYARGKSGESLWVPGDVAEQAVSYRQGQLSLDGVGLFKVHLNPSSTEFKLAAFGEGGKMQGDLSQVLAGHPHLDAKCHSTSRIHGIHQGGKTQLMSIACDGSVRFRQGRWLKESAYRGEWAYAIGQRGEYSVELSRDVEGEMPVPEEFQWPGVFEIKAAKTHLLKFHSTGEGKGEVRRARIIALGGAFPFTDAKWGFYKRGSIADLTFLTSLGEEYPQWEVASPGGLRFKITLTGLSIHHEHKKPKTMTFEGMPDRQLSLSCESGKRVTTKVGGSYHFIFSQKKGFRLRDGFDLECWRN